jgi:site-specific recombinase XerD
VDKEIVNSFLLYLKERDASPLTVRSYHGDLRKFMRWFPVASLESTGPLDIAEFKRHLQKKGQKPSTINRALAALSAFFEWAVENGLIDNNPANNVKQVREVKPAPKSLSRRGQLFLMRSVHQRGKARDVAIITFLLHTGLRVSEMCRLTMNDIIIKERSGSVTATGKGNKQRVVPLNATVRDALRKWINVRGNDPGPLFTSQKGGGLSPRSVERLVKKYAYHADDRSAGRREDAFSEASALHPPPFKPRGMPGGDQDLQRRRPLAQGSPGDQSPALPRSAPYRLRGEHHRRGEGSPSGRGQFCHAWRALP